MPQITEPSPTQWTAVDLVERFGPIPLHRVRHDPSPGTATESDVVDIHLREDRLYELVDGVLVEKTVGTYESYLALELARVIANFVIEKDLGVVLGADGMLRIGLGLVRIPDACFISWQRLPNRRIPDQAIAGLVPDLAVEVISRSNTPKEMKRKLQEYFDAGVRLVWYVYPEEREVHVFSTPNEPLVLAQTSTLAGGEVLPGFELDLRNLFSNR